MISNVGTRSRRTSTSRFIGIALVIAGGFITVGVSGQEKAAESTAPPSPTLDAAAASSDEKPAQPWEKGSLRIGGFAATFTSSLTFGVNSSGKTFNAEDRLGLDSSLALFRADALYRPGESRRNQFDIGYAGYHRSGDATFSRDVTIDGNTYPAGAHVDTVLNIDLIRLTYSYAFIQNERFRIALGLGVYAVPLKYSLDVQTGGGHSVVEGADTTFPLPALALRAEFQIVHGLFLECDVNGIYAEISNFKGSLVDLTAGLEYRPWKYVGFGVAYGFTAANVQGEGGSADYPGINFAGSVDIHFSGVLFYGKVLF